MAAFFKNWLEKTGATPDSADKLSYAFLGIAVLILCVLSLEFVKKVVIRLIAHSIRKNHWKWDDVLLENKVFHRLSHIIPAIILRFFAPSFGLYADVVNTGAEIYFTLIILLVIDALLNSVDQLYHTREISKTRPIKGFLQIIKIAVFVVGGVVMLAALMGKSPLVMLSGIGAATAVFSLVFKDSILGFVAGVQLTSNDMVRIGDWIEMPKYNADGSVIEISLNTVKVQNFDRTITTIPAYALISDSFRNWRGMFDAGGRRIIRSVYIDLNSIGFCTPELLEELKQSNLLKEYIETRQAEIEEYNRKTGAHPEKTVNARRLTNIGVFRMYLEQYISSHPGIHQDMIHMVRQLPPEEHGLPLQIYAFTNDTQWINYENIQSDIFDHILSVASKFGLRLYQNPSGYDWAQRPKE